MSAVYRCGVCGGLGHNARTCAFKGLLPPEPPKRRKPKRLTEDEVLEAWELHDAGNSIKSIAAHFDVSPNLVRREFEELGIALHFNELSEREQRIAEALGRVLSSNDMLPERRTVAFARSMQHVKRNARARVPMSARERGMDALASGVWRRVVAANMRRAGLLPRPRAGRPR